MQINRAIFKRSKGDEYYYVFVHKTAACKLLLGE